MKLHYKMQDDYGIASAEAQLERLPLDPGDPKTSWARTEVLKGPRPPLTRPPKITLRIPPRRAKKPETWSFHDIGSHPWAGLPVRMTLVARDHAGNVGKSKSKEITLPERLFFNPFAKAVIEQRRKLVFDPRYRPVVTKALEALTIAPDRFIKDKAFEELDKALKSVCENRFYVSPDLMNDIVKRYAQNTQKNDSSTHILLTKKETEVLQLITEGKKVKDIAFLLELSIKSVETHRKRIMEKLDIHSVAQLTKYAIREGLTSLEY